MLWPCRRDRGRSADRMWDVEACVIPLFSFRPHLSSRAAACGPPGGTRSSGSCSVVVATPTDIDVPDRGCVRRVRFGEGTIEPVLQDRLDRAVGCGADIVAAPGRGLDALRSIALHEAEDAKARAEALLGMRLCLHDRLNSAIVAGPIFSASRNMRVGDHCQSEGG